ncbi:hypothetical protein GOP47_0023371 [Adiantum capillus-veneris]|uniref:Protein kinase domain-containing protein n=1 Tax=Adiantum capillus-veneris TaxID=13818 RepID=A0A9D4Z5U7_ADICA|nr:hypothetical protein GOP47_0023371 [Adiantum capillus-veneris]
MPTALLIAHCPLELPICGVYKAPKRWPVLFCVHEVMQQGRSMHAGQHVLRRGNCPGGTFCRAGGAGGEVEWTVPKRCTKTRIVVGGVVAGIVVVVGALCATPVWRYKASKIKGDKLEEKAAIVPRPLLQTKARVFSLEELKKATAQFHPSNKLGEGGFGIVYKGTLLDGEQVAIKKLSIGSQQGKQEFLNEVNLITSVQHKNLTRLLGCCVENSERILVYEYLHNKSLDTFLFGEARDSRTLNWSTRYGIVVGVSKGLAYLHEESHVRIIHRDIKPSNILLDDQLNPVIADFGLARLVHNNATHINTRVAGTVGYLAPEYAMRGDLSEKVDVFSFGLVSLEILTGKQNFHSSLLTWVWEKYSHKRTLDLVDEKLGIVFFPEQVVRLVHIALLCMQENPKQRPAMSMVTLWLSGMSDILEMPHLFLLTPSTFLGCSLLIYRVECNQMRA